MQGKKLYVGNLSYSVSKEQLEELFGQYGEVSLVNVIDGKGFAFVEMASRSGAEEAKAHLNGQDLGGRALKIDEARPPKKRPSGGFGRR
ncbi:MAG: RNA-binding protein [Deltaproteobacteria bacterium]|nr:RNA-binding protein [Deltaproteobacteria bacterium]MBF0497991.1 RNA-binding protein [Deltaproteobacteria bacterium]MBF0508627.1 RNA-binding protein [Deltaproteobacteria bacterium]MBF0527137.1 RNA-binding protein [Deltaproteobacteria bacterium]